MSGLSINGLQLPKQLSHEDQEKREKAYVQLMKYVEKKRFMIFDSDDVTDEFSLERCIGDFISEKSIQKILIVIDALQNVIIENAQDNRDAHIKRAQWAKRLSKRMNCPVMATVEIRKKDETNIKPSLNDIMESGKYAYNANLVWFLFNEDPKRLEAGDNEIDVQLLYEKNKFSGVRAPRKFIFQREQSRFIEYSDLSRENSMKQKKKKVLNKQQGAKKQQYEPIRMQGHAK